MRDKHDYLQGFGVENDADTRTLACSAASPKVAALRELRDPAQLPAPQQMRGMEQVVSWSVRDETAALRRHHPVVPHFRAETGALTQGVKDDIVDCARTVVKLEDRFVDLAFEIGPIEVSRPPRSRHTSVYRRLAPEAVRPATRSTA
jgi:ribonucleoside-diphosphate reductase beta chain